MSFAEASLFAAVLLVVTVLVGTLLGRLPLSGAMVFLGLGWLMGPDVTDFLRPDPFLNDAVLALLAEAGLSITLFAVALRLGVPRRGRGWRLPLRLAFVSMAAMVALVTAVGIWWLGLPLGAAVLLGAILAPTDPVLAASPPADADLDPGRLGVCIAAEGGLNDSAAFPFVVLGLALLSLHDPESSAVRGWSTAVVWASLGGVAIGALLGAATGRLLVRLRRRPPETAPWTAMLGLGLMGMTYGIAQIGLGSGLPAVFAAGLVLQRVRERPSPSARLPRNAAGSEAAADGTPAPPPDPAGIPTRDSLQGFSGQLETLAEMVLVLVVGAMLAHAAPLPAAWWFVPLLLLVLRPLSVAAATAGTRLSTPQRAAIGWFGLRSIGSVFYLLFALRCGLEGGIADSLVSLTLWTVVAAIVTHGLTAQPLLDNTLGWRQRARDWRGRDRGHY